MVKIKIKRNEEFERNVMPELSVRVIDAYVYCNTEEGLRFLLLKRASSKIYEHLWQGVAGKIENPGTRNEGLLEIIVKQSVTLPKEG